MLTNKITLVLRAKEGETLADLLPHIHLGALVAVGTGVGVISGASDRDVTEPVSNGFCIDTRIKEVAAQVDPRQLFARINPTGASAEELEMGRNGFVDDRVHGDFLIWKSGFNAALEAEQ